MKLLESSLLKALSVLFIEIAQISAQDPSSMAGNFKLELDDEELCQRLKEQNSQILDDLSISPISNKTSNTFKSSVNIDFSISALDGSPNKDNNISFPIEIINRKNHDIKNNKIESISCRPIIVSISKDKKDINNLKSSFYFSIPPYYNLQSNSKINNFDVDSFKKDEKVVGITDFYDMMNNNNFSIESLKFLFFLIISQAVITIFIGAFTQIGKNIIGDMFKRKTKATTSEVSEKTLTIDIPTLIDHIHFLIDRYLKNPENGDKYDHNSNFILIVSCLKTLLFSYNIHKFSDEDIKNLFNKVNELIENNVFLKNKFSNENLSYNNTEHFFTFYKNALFNNFHENIKPSF